MRARPTARRGGAALASLAAVALASTALAGTAAAADPGDPRGPVDKTPAAALPTAPVKDEQPPASDKLGQHDRELLETARAKGAKRVTLILATEKRQAGSVASSVRAGGGWTGTVDDRVGYVRASVPTSGVERVVGLAKVVAVDLDETLRLPDPTAGSGAGAASADTLPGPGPSTPNANPYMPTQDLRSVTFKTDHPTWDGRGTTIGILDSGVDLDHPALQTTSTGQRKIVDWVTATDPVLDGDLTWRPMLTSVTGPTFTYASQTWTAPGAGPYYVNRFSESITANSEPAGDVNRDGDTTDRFGVLYDPASHDIWVDANQDRTFTADERMRPYRGSGDVRHFGTDDPATAVVERMPFVVEYREDVSLAPYGDPSLPPTADFVNIGIVEDAHGSHVAGITAAHSMFGGAMDGQAPGARLVSSRACTWGGGCTAAALTDGMVDLVVDRGVDVVNMSIGGLPALNDANNARARLYDRLISDFGVQLFISAGNSGPGTNTIGDPSVATDVVSVASSISKATWLANYGSVVSTPLALHNFSSRGPREDGGFKPNVMAPGSAVSTVPQWLEQPDVAEAGYALPVGYAMFNGTSMASPQAAGAASLLLSAAYDRGVPVTPRQLRDAMFSSARFVPGVEAVAQGNGQVDVPRAWGLVRQALRTRAYTTDAPVCTPLSDLLARPGRGTGVYNRCPAGQGGQRSGQSRTYAVKLTRSAGPAGAVRHTVRFLGNDGTFGAPAAVSLRRGEATTVRVTARTSRPGLHSAVMLVDDPATPQVDHRVMLAVTLSQELSAPSFARTLDSSVGRNLNRRMLVTVPEGAKALQVNLTGIATRSQVRWIAFNPYGVPMESTSSLVCYTNFSDRAACNPNSRSYANPIPGVWELMVESRRTSPFLTNPFTLTAAAQGVTVSPETQTVTPAASGATPVTWTVRNDFGPVTVTPRGGILGSARTDRPTIANGGTAEFTVEVPAGAARFEAAIGNPSDAGADLDLYVYRNGVLVGRAADGDSEEAVTIANPPAGTYTVEVDGYAVPSGSTEYDYRDVFYAPALGTLAVPTTAITLDRGETATVTGEIRAGSAPTEGRSFFGRMDVVSTEGAVLGSGSVVVAGSGG
jgi:hypothetical protein